MQPNCYTAGYLLTPNSGSVYDSTKKEDQKLIRLEKLAEKLLPSIFIRSKLLYHDSLIFHSWLYYAEMSVSAFVVNF